MASTTWLVLVVDDEVPLVRVMRRTLEAAGFGVLTASDGPSALALAASHGSPIHLLVTDLVMPGMTGPELYAQLVTSRPNLPVIFVSGIVPRNLPPGSVFLAKPFEPSHLVAAAKALLGI